MYTEKTCSIEQLVCLKRRIGFLFFFVAEYTMNAHKQAIHSFIGSRMRIYFPLKPTGPIIDEHVQERGVNSKGACALMEQMRQQRERRRRGRGRWQFNEKVSEGLPIKWNEEVLEIGKRKITKERSRGDRENERNGRQWRWQWRWRRLRYKIESSGDSWNWWRCQYSRERRLAIPKGNAIKTAAYNSIWMVERSGNIISKDFACWVHVYVCVVCVPVSLYLSFSICLCTLQYNTETWWERERERECVCVCVCVYIESGRLLMRRHKKWVCVCECVQHCRCTTRRSQFSDLSMDKQHTQPSVRYTVGTWEVHLTQSHTHDLHQKKSLFFPLYPNLTHFHPLGK